jgi:hypothetical protein
MAKTGTGKPRALNQESVNEDLKRLTAKLD